MTKTALISMLFAGYVAIMFAVASIPGEAPGVVSQMQTQHAVN